MEEANVLEQQPEPKKFVSNLPPERLINGGPGRPKGVPNKATRTFRAAIMDVYDKLQKGKGGDNAHFLHWAGQNPTEFYKIASRLIPVQLQQEFKTDDASVAAIESLVEELRELRRLRAAEGAKTIEGDTEGGGAPMKEAKRIGSMIRNGRPG